VSIGLEQNIGIYQWSIVSGLSTEQKKRKIERLMKVALATDIPSSSETHDTPSSSGGISSCLIVDLTIPSHLKQPIFIYTGKKQTVLLPMTQ